MLETLAIFLLTLWPFACAAFEMHICGRGMLDFLLEGVYPLLKDFLNGDFSLLSLFPDVNAALFDTAAFWTTVAIVLQALAVKLWASRFLTFAADLRCYSILLFQLVMRYGLSQNLFQLLLDLLILYLLFLILFFLGLPCGFGLAIILHRSCWFLHGVRLLLFDTQFVENVGGADFLLIRGVFEAPQVLVEIWDLVQIRGCVSGAVVDWRSHVVLLVLRRKLVVFSFAIGGHIY